MSHEARVLALSRALPLPDCGAPPAGLVLRGYEPRDWPAYMKLDLEAAIASGQAYHTSPAGFSTGGWLQLRREFFRPTPAGPAPIDWTIAVLADPADCVVAQVSWLLRALPGRRVMEITSIGVHSSHRRSGLARFLLGHAARCAAPHGLSHVVLNVARENGPAVCFYEALGFQRDRWDAA